MYICNFFRVSILSRYCSSIQNKYSYSSVEKELLTGIFGFLLESADDIPLEVVKVLLVGGIGPAVLYVSAVSLTQLGDKLDVSKHLL